MIVLEENTRFYMNLCEISFKTIIFHIIRRIYRKI